MTSVAKAKVLGSKNATKHLVMSHHGVTQARIPHHLVIAEENGCYMLLRNDPYGVCLADTWHETVADAKQQASFEYLLEDWESIDGKSD
jgi:hypothetical protein